MLEKVPDSDSARDGDVERVFRASLGDFKADVALIDDFLVDTVDFMPEDESIASPVLGFELLELDATLDLFETAEGVTVALECGDTFVGRRIVAPSDGVFRSESRFVNFWRGRTRADAAEDELLDGKCVTRAEDCSDVVEAANIVENHGQ